VVSSSIEEVLCWIHGTNPAPTEKNLSKRVKCPIQGPWEWKCSKYVLGSVGDGIVVPGSWVEEIDFKVPKIRRINE
jgi:hypothetical protein